MTLSVNIAARDLSKLATYIHSGVLELYTKSFFRRSWHQRYVVLCKGKSCPLSFHVFENHLAEKAEAVYSVKEFESVRNYENAERNIIGFTIRFEKTDKEPLVFSCDTEGSQKEWMEFIRSAIIEAHSDSGYASGGSACRDSARNSKPYFTIEDSNMLDVEEIPQDINNENKTLRKKAEASSTTTVDPKDGSTNEYVKTAQNAFHVTQEKRMHRRKQEDVNKDNVGNSETTLFQIQESKEDNPNDTKNEQETSMKITETTTLNIPEAPNSGRVRKNREKHSYENVVPNSFYLHETKTTRAGKTRGRENAVKDRVNDRDETDVKAVASFLVQESKAGTAMPGASGKYVVKGRKRGLTTRPVQASDDEDRPENPYYENVYYVSNAETVAVEMENLKLPVKYDGDSDHSGREETPTGQGFAGLTFESNTQQSEMLSVRQPQSSQMKAESFDCQNPEAQNVAEKETLYSCSSSFSSVREGKDQMSLQIDGQHTDLTNALTSVPVSSKSPGHFSFTKPAMSSRQNAMESNTCPKKVKLFEDIQVQGHRKISNKSRETGPIKNTRNLPSSDSSASFSSVGSDTSFKYESPEDTDQDERRNFFKREDYFCPNRKRATREIEEAPVGTFLVYLNRENCEVICVMTDRRLKHFKIHGRMDGYSLFQPPVGTVFSTIDELLSYYHLNNLPSAEFDVKLERGYKSK